MTLNYGNSRKRRLVLARARQEASQQAMPAANLTHARLESNPRAALRFLQDCHAPLDAVLTVANGDGTPGLRFRLDRPNWLIGSDPSCDLVLPSPDVLPVQGVLQWVAGSLARIHWAPVSNGVELRIQWWKPRTSWSLPGFKLHWNAETPVTPPMVSPHGLVEEQSGFDSIELVANNHSGKESPRFGVDRYVSLIGRFSGCDIRLNDRSVQPLHAALVLHGTNCWVVDLSGRGIGTASGRESYLSLDPGDQFSLGDFDCELRRTEPIVVPAAVASADASVSKTSRSVEANRVDPMQILAEFAKQQANVLGGMQQLLSRLQQQPGEATNDSEQLESLRRELDRFSEMGRQQLIKATGAMRQNSDSASDSK